MEDETETEKIRQGETNKGVRYVLLFSGVGAAIALLTLLFMYT